MAEEKPDSENPGCDLGKNASLDTTSVADPTQDRIEDEAPIPQAPNFPLLVLSWGAFTIGLYFLYAAGMGCYGGSSSEAKLAFTTLLGILAIPVGFFLRKWAYSGLAKALGQAPPGVDISQR